MGDDEDIRVVALYIESMRNGRRFFELAQEIIKKKPMIVLRGGETEAGTRTAASHTGAIAGERIIWQAFFRQTGVIHVGSPDEWMDAILALALLPPPASPGVFLFGIGGGASVVSSDTCILEGLDVPSPSPATMNKLRETVPIAGSIAGNPLDDFQACVNPVYFGAILDLVYQDPAIGMVVADRLIPRKAFHTFHRLDSVSSTIEQVKQKGHRKPVVFVLDSEGGDPELAAQGARLRAEFGKGGIPAYPSVKRAVRALTHLYHYYHRLNAIKGPDLE